MLLKGGLFLTAFNLHPLSSQKTCLVCGKVFESYQTFDFLCSDTCKEIYVNQGGLPSQDPSILRTTLQTSTGLLTLYAIGTLSTPSPSSEFSTMFNSKQAIEAATPATPDRVLPDLLKGADSPYQNPICLNPTSLEWETQSHQTGFVLKDSPTPLKVKLADGNSYHLVEEGNLSPLILDQKAPILQQFKSHLNQEAKTLQVDWQFDDPIQETSLIFQSQNTCGDVIEEEQTLTHRSGLKQIVLSLDGTPMTLDPTQTTYHYSNLTYGTHTLTLKAIDYVGNVSEMKHETFELLEPIQAEETPPLQTENSNTSNSENTQTPSQSNTNSSNNSSSNSPSSSTQKPVQDSNSSSTEASTPNQTPETPPSNGSSSSSETKPTYSLPNDTKGSILTRISSRHSSISESDYYRILKGAYDITPTFVLQAVENAGFDIVLTGNNIRDIVRAETGWDAGWNYHGVTFPNYQGYKRIWSSLKGGSNILVHEIGHAYDYAVGRPSSSEAFKALYQAEALKLFPGGGLYAESEGEYYAESFRMYLNERSKVKSRAPQTAAYFKTVFGF